MQAQSSHALALTDGEVTQFPRPGANSDLAAGLRELAGWLEDHPELHRASWATVSLRAAGDDQPARETLTLAAEALGEQVTESRRHHDGRDLVDVAGRFGPVKVIASAYLGELAQPGDEPQDIEPITAGYRDEDWWLTATEIDRIFREASS